MEVYIVYNDDLQKERLEEAFKEPPFSLTFIDVRGKEKKNAWAIKNKWAARLDPFAIIMDGDKAIKAFYSETGEDVINSLISFLNENSSNRRS